ncbi:MAG: hypothetical protein WCO42_09935, partial [bacterium]
IFGWVWLALLVVATGFAFHAAYIRYRRDRWPSLDMGLLFAGISWMCLLMFLFSTRSHAQTYRYLLLLVWAFPFIVIYLYAQFRKWGRIVLGTLTLLIVGLNAANSSALIMRWSHPDFSDWLDSHDMTPVINYLDEQGIRHAYASYADAYRLTFATDERIVCSQVYNERFPDWPIPYKETIVDPAAHVAFVLSREGWFSSSAFERDLASMQVLCRKKALGEYVVYSHFVLPPGEGERIQPVKADASHNAEHAAHMIGRRSDFWRCNGSYQTTGMWVSVEWDTPRKIGKVVIDYGRFPQDAAGSVYVSYLADDKWEKFPDVLHELSDPFKLQNGHPVYYAEMARIELPVPVETHGLKIELAAPRTNRAWTIHDVGVIPCEEVVP